QASLLDTCAQRAGSQAHGDGAAGGGLGCGTQDPPGAVQGDAVTTHEHTLWAECLEAAPALIEARLGALQARAKRPVQPRRNAAIGQGGGAKPEHAARRRLGPCPELSQPVAPSFELPARAQPCELGSEPLQTLGAAAQQTRHGLAEAGAPLSEALGPAG